MTPASGQAGGSQRPAGIFGWIDSLVNRTVKNYTLMIVLGIVILLLIARKAQSLVFPAMPGPPVYAQYVVPQTEWSPERRERYYQTSQGSLVMPYAWFRALELRTGREMFSAPEVQARYGLLPDNDPVYNPDQLPVGIVKNVVEDPYVDLLGEGQKVWASISCAACHTGQLVYRGTAFRIDGGQSFWNFDQWSADLVFSLMITSSVPSRFERFCSRVYGHGEHGGCSTDEKVELRKSIKRYFDSDLIMNAVNAIFNHTYLSTEGFTRTAALGRGVNGEFGPLDYRNVNQNSGPVSFPPLWFTHDYDWVQSVTAIGQPLGRNVTEAWGVSVRVELKDEKTRFATTAQISDMFWMETMIGILPPPKWPASILGNVDRARAERGRALYWDAVWPNALPAKDAELPESAKDFIAGPNPNRPTNGYCARCHAPAFQVNPDKFGRRYLQLPLYRMEVMGTDPDDAKQFNARQVHTSYLAPIYGNQQVVGIGTALQVSIGGILDRWFNEHSVPAACRDTMEGYRPNEFRAPVAYPARPLDGYWSTGPFLHNGSVRTIYELLSPVEQRAKSFYIGSREFDPGRLGYSDNKVEGAFLFDTSKPGNSRTGHEFRDAPPNTPGVIGPYLKPEERLDIIEYMKVMETVKIDEQQLAFRRRMLDAMAPYFEKYEQTFGARSGVPYGTPEREGGWKMTDLCRDVANAVPAPATQVR